MRNFRKILLFAALAFAAISCNYAGIKGTVGGMNEGSVLTIKELKGSERVVRDSVVLDGRSSFNHRLKMERGERNFFFLYSGGKKLSSLILSPGDKVEIACDTTGSWTVSGSDECEDLRRNELALAAVSRKNPLTMKDFVEHYRKMLNFVMTHSHSLTVVPVLYQKIRDIPVFAQPSDGVILSSVADSLETVYPTSPYVAMLRNSSKEKLNMINLQYMIEKANSVDYPQIDLPDLNGEFRKLSDCAASRTLVVFWDASEVKNKMFNQDVLMPAFEKYGDALTIYQVGLLSDKATWALTVRQQSLPWVNVYDVTGSTIQAYRISALPSVFVLQEGKLRRIENPDKKAVLNALK